jgi:hypothetical protein
LILAFVAFSAIAFASAAALFASFSAANLLASAILACLSASS